MVPRSTRSYWNELFYVQGANKVENELLKIKDEALEKIEACTSLKELNDIRVLYLGKKGPIQEAMKSMKNMDPDQRKTFGQTSNKVKQELSKAVEDKKEVLEEYADLIGLAFQVKDDILDVEGSFRTSSYY